MIEQLINARVDETGELDFGDGPETLHREPNRDSCNPRFGERRIHDTLLAEGLEEAFAGAKDATIDADVLAQQQHACVLRHRAAQSEIDRLY